MNVHYAPAMHFHNRGFSTGMGVILLLFLIASAGVVWVYNGMTTPERWPLRWLEIDGPFERLSAEQLRAKLAPLITGSFFTVDIGTLRVAVADMAWVANVSVQKSWPDTIHVTIHEYTPVAHWIGGSLVAANGHSFKVPVADEIRGLPWLESPANQLATVFGTWQKIDGELASIGQHTKRLSLDPRGSWSAVLNGGTELRLGKGDIFGKLDLLVTTWSGLMHGRVLPPVSVDLRYTNGFAVLWPQSMDKIAGNYGKKN